MKTESQKANVIRCVDSFLAANRVTACGLPHRRRLAVDHVPKTRKEMEFLLLQHMRELNLLTGSFPGIGRDLIKQLYE